MPHESQKTATTEGGWQREWANWWQGYWSDTPGERPAPAESAPVDYPWRESKHEFDFGGEQ